jgi:hypothetical protein
MRTPLLLAFAALLGAGGAEAQKTGDQSRLVFSLTGGYASGHDLWSVGGQSLTLDGQTDIFALERNLTGTWTAGLGVVYFGGENLGFTVDAQLIDTRLQDSCVQLTNSGSSKNQQVCTSIDGATRSAMAALLSGGVILRAASRAKVSPYLRVQGGAYFGNVNTTSVQGTFLSADSTELVFVNIYPGGSGTHFSPQASLGAGVTVPVAKAYHLRFEGRVVTYSLDVITGATGSAGTEPNTGTKWITQWTLTAGVDIVLERKRGRRY